MGTVESVTSSTTGGENNGSEDGRISLSDLPQGLTSKYEIVDAIGKGAFGCVYKIRDKTTRRLYAGKVVDNIPSNKAEAHLQAGLHDIEQVVKVYDIMDCDHNLILIMEYCDGGNLLEWIERNRRHNALSERVILQMLFELCEAVHSCHQHRVIHRDIKPENVLLDSRRRVKLGDFGVARRLNKHSFAKSFCGTPPYMAPELFLSYLSNPSNFETSAIGYDAKCDVWSIGCILYDMSNNKGRFVYDLHSSLGFDAARKLSETVIEKDICELIDIDTPKDFHVCRKLMKLMLVKSPSIRITLIDVLQDLDLKKVLENPENGHWSDMLEQN